MKQAVSPAEIENMLAHADHFGVLANGKSSEAQALLKAASPAFRHGFRTAVRLATNENMHRNPDHGATPKEANLAERVAANKDPEGNDALHKEIVEMHGSGLGGWFKKLGRSIKHGVEGVGHIVTAPFHLAVAGAKGAKKAARNAARGDFQMTNDALSAGERALGLYAGAAGV